MGGQGGEKKYKYRNFDTKVKLCVSVCVLKVVDIVRVLLKSNAIQINLPDKDGVTPFIIATYLGHSSIVQALLSNNNIDLSPTFEDKTALQYSESHVRVHVAAGVFWMIK
jgi:ankyrin repeat protein